MFMAAANLKPLSSVIRSDALLRNQYNHRSTLIRVKDYVLSIFNDLNYYTSFLFKLVFGSSKYHLCDKKLIWKKDSSGLCVLLHGFKGHPSIWDPHLKILNEESKIDVFVPFVPKAGNCSLEEAASPILPNIIDYTKNHPDKPICLIGVSNGGRLATWLEVQLRTISPSTPVKVSTIAGVHFGTPIIQLLEKLKLAKFFLSPVIRKELSYGNVKAKTY